MVLHVSNLILRTNIMIGSIVSFINEETKEESTNLDPNLLDSKVYNINAILKGDYVIISSGELY